MKKQKAVLAILYVGAAITVSGCILAAVGAGAAGTVAYVKGDLEVVETKNLDAVYAASKKALCGPARQGTAWPKGPVFPLGKCPLVKIARMVTRHGPFQDNDVTPCSASS